MKKHSILFMVACCCVVYGSAQQGSVGINTQYPKATLHVAGTIRTDSAKVVTSTKRFAVLDSVGVIQSLDVDSVKNVLQVSTGYPTCYYASNEMQASTTSNILQVRVTLTLPPGTYLLFGYFEAFNINTPSGVRGQMNEGPNEIAYGALYSDQSTFSPWSAMKQVSPMVATTYSLMWASWPIGGTSLIRRARMWAIRIA